MCVYCVCRRSSPVFVSVVLQGLCHAVRKEAWKFLLGYFPWTSTQDERKALQRLKT